MVDQVDLYHSENRSMVYKPTYNYGVSPSLYHSPRFSHGCHVSLLLIQALKPLKDELCLDQALSVCRLVTKRTTTGSVCIDEKSCINVYKCVYIYIYGIGIMYI